MVFGLIHRLFGCEPFWKYQHDISRYSIHQYYECSFCGRRGVQLANTGYQPINTVWLHNTKHAEKFKCW